MSNTHTYVSKDNWKILTSIVIAAIVTSTLLNGAVSPVAAISSPQITLSQSSGYYDQIIQIHGTDFTPFQTVTITWSALNYWKVTATASSSGNFDLPINVPDGLTAGNYIIRAIDQSGNVATANFALYTVFANSASFGIRSPKQYVQWNYDSSQFYCDLWQFYQNSMNGLYTVLNHNYGVFVLRLTYSGVTYVYDLVGGKFNSWPTPLVEKVSGFTVKDVNHVQGTIQVYDPSGSVLLVTMVMDVYAPTAPREYYAVIFTVTAETNIDNLTLYAAQNLDVWVATPNWGYYDRGIDAVYQYYGPAQSQPGIYEQYTGYAGFGSVTAASAHHDAALYYTDVQNVASNLKDYDFNFRDRDEANCDFFGNPGVGLQWNLGPMSTRSTLILPIGYAESGQTKDSFEANLKQSKLLAYQFLSQSPSNIVLSSNQGPGLSILNISGSGFTPFSMVNLTFSNILMKTIPASSDGAFQTSVVVPTTIAGGYGISAADEYGLTATAPFTVTEITPSWLLTQLNAYNAQVTGLVSSMNGNLSALLSSNMGNMLASLSDIKATVTGLTSSNGQILAKIDTITGSITTTIQQINGTISGLVRDANNTLSAKIDTAVGSITATLQQVNGAISGLVRDANNTLSAKIDTAIGSLTTALDLLNGTLTSVNGTVATIRTDLGTVQTNIANLNATLKVINSSTVQIESAIGNVTGKIDGTNKFLDGINSTIIAFENKTDGAYLSLSSDFGNMQIKLDGLNLVMKSVKDDTATIQTNFGTVNATLETLGAAITAVKGDTATIQTNIGILEANVSDIKAQIVAVKGDLVTVKTSIGNIQLNLTDINAKLIATNGKLATIQTDIGTITGNITSIEGDLVTINTNIGTITTKTMKNEATQNTILTGIGSIIAIIFAVCLLYVARRQLYSIFRRNNGIKQPSKAGHMPFIWKNRAAKIEENSKAVNEDSANSMMVQSGKNEAKGLISEERNFNKEIVPDPCPKCGKTINGAVVKLDFNDREAKLVNVCPHCNYVLGKMELPEESI